MNQRSTNGENNIQASHTSSIPSDEEIIENLCRNDPGSCAGW